MFKAIVHMHACSCRTEIHDHLGTYIVPVIGRFPMGPWGPWPPHFLDNVFINSR